MAVIGVQRKQVARGPGNDHFFQVSNRFGNEAAGHFKFSASIGRNEFRAAEKTFLCPQRISNPLAVILLITISGFHVFGGEEPFVENAVADSGGGDKKIGGCSEYKSAEY